MRSKFKWILTLMVAFAVQVSFAQEKNISGKVLDNDKQPLPGVNIVVKGTKRGTQTDFDGNYSIKANVGETLVYSFLGMKDKAVVVGANTTMNVTMESSDRVLDEVVVVGYGVQRKEAFTGTVTVVSKANVEAKTVSNVGQALRGEVAGVNVITTSGAPGSDATIRIRGFGSVNGNRNPLYVVDGAPYSSDISAINPADIENMTVLKDAAATSIYGTRGANGVILITTKKGKVGKSNLSIDFKTSVNSLMLPNYDIIDSPEEYIEMAWNSLKTKGALLGYLDPASYASLNLYSGTEGINYHYNIWNRPGNQLIDPSTGKMANGVSRKYTPTKWSDAAFGTGYRSEANIQLSGGSDKTRFATSFGYLDDQGYAINSNYKRYTTRLSLEHKPLDWFKFDGNIAYTGGRYTNSSSDEGSSGSSGNIFALVNTTPAIYDVYLRDENGNLIADPIFGGSQYDYGASYDPDGDPSTLNSIAYDRRAWNSTNGIADAHYDLSQNDATTLLGNFNFNFDITKWMKLETRYSGQYQNYEAADRNNPYYGGWSGDTYGALFKRSTKVTNQNFLQLLRFNKSFGDHSLEAFVAHETTEWRYKRFSAAATHAILPNTLDLGQYTTVYGRPDSYTYGTSIESYFSQLNYDYKSKYFLSASLRRDGSSRYIEDKWGTFGSVGLGWIVSKENFLSKFKFLNYLKLKASYGILGDQGNEYQYGWSVYKIDQTPDGSYSFTQDGLKNNPRLTWETSKIAQVGVESSWFNNRLDVDVDYYVKNTENLFFTQTLPPFSGYTVGIMLNDGQLRNSGLEFDLNYKILQAKNIGDLTVSFGLNGEVMKNEITQMPIDVNTGSPKILDGSYSQGHSLYDWYMPEWAGVDSATGAGLWNMYYDDANNNGVFDNADDPINSMTIYMAANPNANVKSTTTSNYAQATRKYVGKSAIPDVRGSFRLSATFKNFDLTSQFGYSLGGYVYDSGYSVLMDNGDLIGSNNWHRDMHNSWKKPGDVTDVPRLSSGLSSDVNWNATSSRFLTKADYLSLNNIKIGYTFPEKVMEKLFISKLNLFVSGDNLMMLSKRDGLNPTTMVGTSNSGIYTPMTTFSLGAKIEF